MACTCSVLVGRATITTNVGKLLLRAPSPYELQAPRHGRPATWLPVCMSVIAGSWLVASVCMLRMTTSSSAAFFSHGHRPLNPHDALDPLDPPPPISSEPLSAAHASPQTMQA